MQPTILILFGITGDLARRKLLPALIRLEEKGLLPKGFRLIGSTRNASVTTSAIYEGIENGQKLIPYTTLVSGEHIYESLQKQIASIEEGFGTSAQKLFYLSVPSTTMKSIVEGIIQAGFNTNKTTKLLIEKPFGSDAASAKNLDAFLHASFAEEQIFRVDHYLAKESIRDLIAYRTAHDRLPETITAVRVVATESLGIEGRANFYEETGALRDLFQSHLLELASLVLMPMNDAVSFPERRVEALRSFEVVPATIRFGQYEGYREEVGNADSTVETYISATLRSTLPGWEHIRFDVTTGKNLSEKNTEIRLIGNKEDIVFSLATPMQHNSYETTLMQAFAHDRSLFISSEEVRQLWRIVTPIQEFVTNKPELLQIYKKGSAMEDLV